MTNTKKPGKISKPQATPDNLNKAFIDGLIKDFDIQDREKFDQFWFTLQVITDFKYGQDNKGDDLSDIASQLKKIINTLEFGNPTTRVRLGNIGKEMISKLDEYKEICLERHKPPVNNAPIAYQMDALVEHVGDYLIYVLKIPFHYSKVDAKRRQPAKEFLKRIARHVGNTKSINIRGLDEAAARYIKKLKRVRKRPKIKLKKKPLKSAR
jgi:hypothetical protein